MSKNNERKTNVICILIVPSLFLVSGVFCVYAGCLVLLEGKDLLEGSADKLFFKRVFCLKILLPKVERRRKDRGSHLSSIIYVI